MLISALAILVVVMIVLIANSFPSCRIYQSDSSRAGGGDVLSGFRATTQLHPLLLQRDQMIDRLADGPADSLGCRGSGQGDELGIA